MSGWVWLISSDGLPHRVPDNPGVVASFVGRDYEATDLPGDLSEDDEEFVALLAEWQDRKEVVEDSAEFENSEKPAEGQSATDQEGNE